MKKVLRIFLYIIGGIFVLGIIGKLTGADDNKATPAEIATLTPAQQDSIKTAEAATIKKNTVTATNLVGLYVENEVKADNQLKGQEFYVSGKIDAIGKDLMNKAYITLKSSDPVRAVQCFIDDVNVVAELQKGQKVTIKGTCDGLMMNVIMKDCVVVPQ